MYAYKKKYTCIALRCVPFMGRTDTPKIINLGINVASVAGQPSVAAGDRPTGGGGPAGWPGTE